MIVVPSTGDPDSGQDEQHAALRRVDRWASVVVGLDGTHAGHGALELAFAQAGARGAQLKVVHVWPPAEPLVLSGRYGEGRTRSSPGAVTLGVLAQARCPVAMVRDEGVSEHLRRLADRADAPQVALAATGTSVRT